MTLPDLLRAARSLDGAREVEATRLQQLDEELSSLHSEEHVLTGTDEALKVLLSTIQAELQTDIERLIQYGLRVVFPDLGLGFRLDTTEKRGGPWVEPLLVGPVEGPILDSFGGGPASLVAFLLRVLTLKRAGLAPVLLLDEPFTPVSSGYRDLVGKLLRELADKAGLTIVMVTHDTTYLEFATKGYQIDTGTDGAAVKPYV